MHIPILHYDDLYPYGKDHLLSICACVLSTHGRSIATYMNTANVCYNNVPLVHGAHSASPQIKNLISGLDNACTTKHNIQELRGGAALADQTTVASQYPFPQLIQFSIPRSSTLQ